ncbi:unnamed protein product [Parnassius apollo]|uniref:Hexosyltransferase n=1 Tax=Parnassius apollo TaxID=110799 RepID=A0A8S3WCB2_PARAO|nr:unnamed protein product [Parnassius apollo]
MNPLEKQRNMADSNAERSRLHVSVRGIKVKMLSRCVVSQVKHNSYFLVGLALGLWLALATVPLEEESAACVAPAAAVGVDEWEPVREQREMGAAGAAGRSVQRPRYYSTELGMRAGLLAGALTSEEALGGRAAALNRTAARLLPALRFFITASALRSAPAGANVVGFTDTREMLKPFHALKYLADNYLEEYDFFFLVTDTTFVNAQRLTELVSRLSVSQDVYMGTVAEDDTQYCSLESGILLSNSVLRAIHGALDWCVRNSYSPHHHENIGRCVLHAAHITCTSFLQGDHYLSWKLTGEMEPQPALADAVTAHPVHTPEHLYQLHAYVSRVLLQRAQEQVSQLRVAAALSARRHPRGFRNVSWPAGLRATPGLAAPPPATRFDHLRWTTFNATHALLPDDHRAAAPLTGPTKAAIDLVLEEGGAWARRRWASARVTLLEGAWCWQPPHALRYRLLLQLQHERGVAVRQLEVARVLGGARLAPARYVTESARVLLLLPLRARHVDDARALLRRLDACLRADRNAALLLLLVVASRNESAVFQPVRDAVRELAAKHRGADLDLMETELDVEREAAGEGEGESEDEVLASGQRLALRVALPRLPPDQLVLLGVPHMDFNQDFLNREFIMTFLTNIYSSLRSLLASNAAFGWQRRLRLLATPQATSHVRQPKAKPKVRMNTIAGEQWFLPVAFARYAQFLHPRFVDAAGARAQQGTGRFNARRRHVVAFYRADYDAGKCSCHTWPRAASRNTPPRSSCTCASWTRPARARSRAPAASTRAAATSSLSTARTTTPVSAAATRGHALPHATRPRAVPAPALRGRGRRALAAGHRPLQRAPPPRRRFLPRGLRRR